MKHIITALVAVTCFVLPTVLSTGYGHGHGYGHSSIGIGTACIVKGSYCQCHYCKCEKGHIHCKGHGHGGGYGKKSKIIDKDFRKSFQEKSTAMEVWKASTAIVITASVNMVSVRMEKDTRDVRDIAKHSNRDKQRENDAFQYL